VYFVKWLQYMGRRLQIVAIPRTRSLITLWKSPGRVRADIEAREDKGHCSGLSVKEEIDDLGFAAGDGDLAALRAVQFVPGGDGVLPRGKLRQGERAIFTGHGEMAGLQYREIPLHPRMDVALHGDEFFLVISVGERGSLCRLDAVPFAIDLGQRMNIVRERVAIGEADVLAHAHR